MYIVSVLIWHTPVSRKYITPRSISVDCNYQQFLPSVRATASRFIHTSIKSTRLGSTRLDSSWQREASILIQMLGSVVNTKNKKKLNLYHYLKSPLKPYNFYLKHFSYLLCFSRYLLAEIKMGHCNVYRVSHFKLPTPITFLFLIVQKNVSNKSCLTWRGTMMAKIWPWIVIWESHKGHLQFLNYKPPFFIAYSCNLSRELSKTL